MAVTDVLSGPLSDSEHRVELRKAVIASTVGTTIEWYDFLLYSVVTGLVFGKALSILTETELLKPIRNLLHRRPSYGFDAIRSGPAEQFTIRATPCTAQEKDRTSG